MKIKEVSEKYNLTPDTLYDIMNSIGLISQVPRNKNGIREYSDENCANIAFIKYALRAADVSIEGLAAYLKLYRQDSDTHLARRKILSCREKQRLTEKMNHIQEALDRLDTKLRLLDES